MANLPVTQYQDKDDALHPYPGDGYYEWWYLDAQFDNGYSCVITFHYRLVFAEPHMPGIQLHIYTPDGKNVVTFKPFDVKDCIASEERCDVKMGNNFVRQEKDGSYKVFIRTRRAGAELTFKNILPGWKPDGSAALLDEAGAVQGWCVPIPRGEVEGTLYIGETPVKVKGNRGYHDHNWGNCNMHDYFKGWYWGRLYDEKYTLIYGWVYPMDEKAPISAKLYLGQGNKPLLATQNYTLKEAKIETDPELKREYAKDLTLSCNDKGVEFNCQMITKNVVEKVDMSAAAKWPTFYWRFLADYNAEVKANGKTEKVQGETIHEYMLFK
ncbi:MAG: hypothetical protein JXA01_06020 [Dehalococcoidia bacterium]|nr:hypothetical protein [Dehalococcoidia bacterium]